VLTCCSRALGGPASGGFSRTSLSGVEPGGRRLSWSGSMGRTAHAARHGRHGRNDLAELLGRLDPASGYSSTWCCGTELEPRVLAQSESFSLSNVTSAGGQPRRRRALRPPGSYLNGVYESVRCLRRGRLRYPEAVKRGNVTTPSSSLLLDDQPFDVRSGELRTHERSLDFRSGLWKIFELGVAGGARSGALGRLVSLSSARGRDRLRDRTNGGPLRVWSSRDRGERGRSGARGPSVASRARSAAVLGVHECVMPCRLLHTTCGVANGRWP